MERNRVYCHLAGSLLAVSLMLGGGVGQVALGAEPPKPGAVKRPSDLPPQFRCPPGWHNEGNPNFPGRCKPDRPKPLKCSEGYVWAEGRDCEVGCRSLAGSEDPADLKPRKGPGLTDPSY